MVPLTLAEAAALVGTETPCLYLSTLEDTRIKAVSGHAVLVAITKVSYQRARTVSREVQLWTAPAAICLRSTYDAAYDATSPIDDVDRRDEDDDADMAFERAREEKTWRD